MRTSSREYALLYTCWSLNEIQVIIGKILLRTYFGIIGIILTIAICDGDSRHIFCDLYMGILCGQCQSKDLISLQSIVIDYGYIQALSVSVR